MHLSTILNFRELRVPPNDGDVLVEPARAILRSLVGQNRQLTEQASSRDRFPWSEYRRWTWERLGLAADAPVVMTGHQPEFIHPGVWAKNVVASRLARAVDGAAVNLVADNDVPKTLSIAVPVAADGGIVVHTVAFAAGPTGRAYEFIEAASISDLDRIGRELASLLGEAESLSAIPEYLAGMRSDSATDFVEQATAGRQAVEAVFDVAVRDVRVSRVWAGPLLADWLRNAREFAAAYNRAVADYRREHRVRGASRPVPDLAVERDRVELPLWACGADGLRYRLFVTPSPDAVRLYAQDRLIGELGERDLADPYRVPQALAAVAPFVVRPRALALTLWARLLACDLFIHGIGGAKYDRITDGIIRAYYRRDPPAMACVSATLHLPLPRGAVSEAAWFAARRRIRDLMYQPDRFLSQRPEAAAFLAEKAEAIRRSDELRRVTPHARAARREVFERIRKINETLRGFLAGADGEARRDLERLRQRREQDRMAADREYFFALFPRQKLRRLCERLPSPADF